MGSVAWTVIFGEAGHSALLQLFDPLNFPLKTIADVDGEPRVLGIEDIPLGAAFEGVGVCFDKVLESVNSAVEFPYFGDVVVFPLLDRLEQGFGNAL